MSIAERQSEAETLRHAMARVRREIDDDMDDVAENAKDMVDWRSYVRKRPFVSLAVAAAIGFAIVPRKLAVMSPTADQLEKLAGRNHLVVKPSATAGAPRSGWKSKAIAFGGNLILRAALAYAGHKLGSVVGLEHTETSE